MTGLINNAKMTNENVMENLNIGILKKPVGSEIQKNILIFKISLIHSHIFHSFLEILNIFGDLKIIFL